MDLLKGYSDKDSASDSRAAAPPMGLGKGHATIKYDNVGVYEGDVIDGKVGGTCKFTFTDGSVYEGDWGGDEPNGRGKMRFNNDGCWEVYDGEWKDGTPQGKGEFTYVNGDRYEGDVAIGGRHGKGKLTYASGSVYEGDWGDDKPNGRGKMKYAGGDDAKGRGMYEGEWKHGMRHGQGKRTHPSGSVYEGEWMTDRVHGKGKYTYFDGKIYEGEWREGKRHGNGTMKYSNGDAYTGEWKESKKHGAGTLKEADGTEYKQEYGNGKRLSSKRVAILINGPSSQRQRTNEAVGVVVLNDEEMRCGICGEDYFFDTDSADEDAKKRLPVITSCDHTCCHGCILKWQVSRAETNSGRVAKRVPCMLCKKKSAICPSEPKYNRMLIDLLGRCVPVKEQESE